MSTSLLEKRLPDGARHADEYADVPELVAELRALPAESGLKLSTVILQAVSATDFSKQAQSPTGLRFDNLYSSALGEDGVWLGAVGWRQLSPLQAEGADALGEFLTLHTDFDFPPADGRPEAVDHLAVRGRASTEPTS